MKDTDGAVKNSERKDSVPADNNLKRKTGKDLSQKDPGSIKKVGLAAAAVAVLVLLFITMQGGRSQSGNVVKEASPTSSEAVVSEVILETAAAQNYSAADKHFNKDIYALCEAYYKTVSDVVNKTSCDIIGHFDLISEFIEREPLFDTNHPRYVAAWRRAADELLKTGVPFEINTGAISRGYRSEPYPSGAMIDYIRERGGRFVLSSDAHSAENIGFRFEEYEELSL